MRHVGSIADILIKVFDLRRLQHSPRAEGVFEDSDIEESESALFETTIAMIYKINDAKFRPVFQKMVDWATDPASDKDGKGTTYRQTTLYAFLSKFFSNLKVRLEFHDSHLLELTRLRQSLVTSYAGFVLEDMVKILKEVSLVDDDSKNLWRQALIALRSAIQHDEDGRQIRNISKPAEQMLSKNQIFGNPYLTLAPFRKLFSFSSAVLRMFL